MSSKRNRNKLQLSPATAASSAKDVMISTVMRRWPQPILLPADPSSLPSSAGSTPDPKKGRIEPNWLELQENIVRLVGQKMDDYNTTLTQIDSSTKSLADLIKTNAQAIQELTVRYDQMFKDLEETQAKVEVVQSVTAEHEKRITYLEEKLNAMDRYSRRMNLRLYGLPELEGEDVKKRFMELCHQVVPDVRETTLPFYVDVCHRLGRRLDSKNRPVIARFTSRAFKEKLWRGAKGSEYMAARKLSFGEDLTEQDKDTRNRLWPHIEAARKQGTTSRFDINRGIKQGDPIAPYLFLLRKPPFRSLQRYMEPAVKVGSQYCVSIRFFDEIVPRVSNFSRPECVYIHSPVPAAPLAVIAVLLVLLVLVLLVLCRLGFICLRKRRLPSALTSVRRLDQRLVQFLHLPVSSLDIIKHHTKSSYGQTDLESSDSSEDETETSAAENVGTNSAPYASKTSFCSGVSLSSHGKGEGLEREEEGLKREEEGRRREEEEDKMEAAEEVDLFTLTFHRDSCRDSAAVVSEMEQPVWGESGENRGPKEEEENQELEEEENQEPKEEEEEENQEPEEECWQSEYMRR
ncbi:hypothetical protein WMY93_001752 [Mugilogobius chulae]|uniref:Uncharacterized protein n=1 Tax=Mugilogobius chulae TaxID=88201 RepID=A0AAW0PRL8_9GOBI